MKKRYDCLLEWLLTKNINIRQMRKKSKRYVRNKPRAV